MYKLLYLVFFLPLMIIFCGDDKDFEEFDFDSFEGNVTDLLYFSQTDTIWIRGEASAYIVGQESGDSVLIESPGWQQEPHFTILRLKPPDRGINSDWAVHNFEILVKSGVIEMPECPTSYVRYYPEFDEENARFTLHIGFIPSKFGSYLLHMQNINFINEVRNFHLLYDHMLPDDHLLVSWERCDVRPGVNLRYPEGKYLFRVR